MSDKYPTESDRAHARRLTQFARLDETFRLQTARIQRRLARLGRRKPVADSKIGHTTRHELTTSCDITSRGITRHSPGARYAR